MYEIIPFTRWEWKLVKNLITIEFRYRDVNKFFLRRWIWDSKTHACHALLPSRRILLSHFLNKNSINKICKICLGRMFIKPIYPKFIINDDILCFIVVGTNTVNGQSRDWVDQQQATTVSLTLVYYNNIILHIHGCTYLRVTCFVFISLLLPNPMSPPIPISSTYASTFSYSAYVFPSVYARTNFTRINLHLPILCQFESKVIFASSLLQHSTNSTNSLNVLA